MSHLQAIVILRREKNEASSDLDNIHIKVTCGSFEELEQMVEEFITGYNRTTPDGKPIFDWYVAKDDDVMASLMIHESDE